MTDKPVLPDLPESHARVLEFLLDRIPPEEIPWALTGSASLRLQGVDLEVHDIDIQADGNSARIIEQLLVGFMKTALHVWESPDMRSLDGKAEKDGIQIEILADVSHKKPDGSWCSYTDFTRLTWQDWHGRRVAVFPLSDEADAYAAMGRKDKAALIRGTIQSLTKLSIRSN
jgi:hypothetical protein